MPSLKGELDRLTDGFRKAGVRAEGLLPEGSPANEIATIARQRGLELIVVGTHGRKGITHFLLGSVAERLVRLSLVPVFIVPSWRYADRGAAGRVLAHELERFRDQRPLVFALSRGAIPIAHDVAQALDAPFDVFFVHQLECDDEPIGAVSEDGTLVVDDPMISKLKIAVAALGAIANHARVLAREEAIRFRGAQWIEDVSGRTVIVVGDGLTTEWPFAVAAEDYGRRGQASRRGVSRNRNRYSRRGFSPRRRMGVRRTG